MTHQPSRDDFETARIAFVSHPNLAATPELVTLYFSVSASAWGGRNVLLTEPNINPDIGVGIDDAGRSMVAYLPRVSSPRIARFSGTSLGRHGRDKNQLRAQPLDDSKR